MAFIKLRDSAGGIKVMIFAEGTILKPKSWFSLYNHKSYRPIGGAVGIIEGWQRQGVDIVYCTSRRGAQAAEMAQLLEECGLVGSKLYFREHGQTYKDIVEEVVPEALIEDDCKSIGGSWQMCITKVDPGMKSAIKSVVTKEFEGIDHLPQSLQELIKRG